MVGQYEADWNRKQLIPRTSPLYRPDIVQALVANKAMVTMSKISGLYFGRMEKPKLLWNLSEDSLFPLVLLGLKLLIIPPKELIILSVA